MNFRILSITLDTKFLIKNLNSFLLGSILIRIDGISDTTDIKIVHAAPVNVQSIWLDILILTAVKQDNIIACGLFEQIKNNSFSEDWKECLQDPPLTANNAGKIDDMPDKSDSSIEESKKSLIHWATGFGIFFAVIYSAATSTSTYNSIDDLRRLSLNRRNAVLMCEHSKIINQLSKLKLQTQSERSWRDAEIKASRNAISFLDQPGDYNYWEDDRCRYGYQWFNLNADNGYRVFVATSKSCKNPIINYSQESNSKIIARGTVRLGSGFTTGVKVLPYLVPNSEYGIFDNVKCSP